jgi:hypothetical protein
MILLVLRHDIFKRAILRTKEISLLKHDPNVLFEAGLAFGRHPEQTILIMLGSLRPFSDIGGRYVIRMDNSIARRQELADRLAAIGCAVDLRGRSDWHHEGNFDAAIHIPQGSAPAKSPSSTQSEHPSPSLSVWWAGPGDVVIDMLDAQAPPQLAKEKILDSLYKLKPTDEELALVKTSWEQSANQAQEEDAVSIFRRYIDKRLELARSDFEQFYWRYALKERAVAPSLRIYNNGTAPAVNIVIYIKPTGKVRFCTYIDLMKLNIDVPDRRPSRVTELIECARNLRPPDCQPFTRRHLSHIGSLSPFTHSILKIPSIELEKGRLRIDSQDSLKHGFNRTIRPRQEAYLYTYLHRGETANIEYECHADNLIAPSGGILRLQGI